MNTVLLKVDNFLEPRILAAEKDFLLVYKPPLMHTAPLRESDSKNIYEWCRLKFPEIGEFEGRKEGEGGLLHRLDYDTHGLLLIARTREGMEKLLLQQAEGRILKTYSVLAKKSVKELPGFPEKPFVSQFLHPFNSLREHLYPVNIESGFRSYGVGRKAVRPETDGDKIYTTEVMDIKKMKNNIYSLDIRLIKGFRHQIRCHLAWAGYSILNDPVYGGENYGKGLLALRAASLSFNDPVTDAPLNFSIPPLLPAFI